MRDSSILLHNTVHFKHWASKGFEWWGFLGSSPFHIVLQALILDHVTLSNDISVTLCCAFSSDNITEVKLRLLFYKSLHSDFFFFFLTVQ